MYLGMNKVINRMIKALMVDQMKTDRGKAYRQIVTLRVCQIKVLCRSRDSNVTNEDNDSDLSAGS